MESKTQFVEMMDTWGALGDVARGIVRMMLHDDRVTFDNAYDCVVKPTSAYYARLTTRRQIRKLVDNFVNEFVSKIDNG